MILPQRRLRFLGPLKSNTKDRPVKARRSRKRRRASFLSTLFEALSELPSRHVPGRWCDYCFMESVVAAPAAEIAATTRHCHSQRHTDLLRPTRSDRGLACGAFMPALIVVRDRGRASKQQALARCLRHPRRWEQGLELDTSRNADAVALVSWCSICMGLFSITGPRSPHNPLGSFMCLTSVLVL